MASKASSTRYAHLPSGLEALEERRMWSASPATPTILAAASHAAHAHAPATGVTNTDRQNIINEWQRGHEQKVLQAALNADNASNDNGAQFDAALLSYMTAQFNGNSHYYFQSGDVPADIALVEDPNDNYGNPFNSALQSLMSNAETELAHKFSGYQEPATIDWLDNPAQFGANDNFIHSLNNQAQFVDFAVAYRLGSDSYYPDAGSSKWVTEIQNELISWEQQNPPLANPDDYHKTSPSWWLLDATGRIQNWLETYSLLIGTPAFTGALNTLFIKEFWLHGDFMDRVTPDPPTSNTVANHGAALAELATVFPEFANSGAWYSHAVNDIITPVLQTQFFSDGGQDEESPGYAKSVLTVLGEVYYMNHSGWPSDALTTLDNAANAYYQELEPDGSEPPLGDTITAISANVLGPLQLELGATAWTQAKLRLPSVFEFGAATTLSTLHDAPDPGLVNRGLAVAQPVTGDYIMRSNQTASANQMIFTAGPTAAAGSPHGHYDLFTFDLFGDDTDLINNPGVDNYVADAERTRLISTPAANTLSINGQNHQYISPAAASSLVKVEQWNPAGSSTQVTAQTTAYQGVSGVNGNPVTTRSIYYDNANTYMVVDFADATAKNSYNVSYNLVGKTSAGANGSIHTDNKSGENVMVVPVLLKGQSTSSTPTTVFTGAATAATYFDVTQTNSTAVFASIVVTYMGTTPPDVTAKWATVPSMTTAGTLDVSENGVVTESASFTQYYPTRNRHHAAIVTSPATTHAAAAVWSALPISSVSTTLQKNALLDSAESLL